MPRNPRPKSFTAEQEAEYLRFECLMTRSRIIERGVALILNNGEYANSNEIETAATMLSESVSIRQEAERGRAAIRKDAEVTTQPIEDAETRIQRIGQLITQPMLYEFFLKDEPGDTFAERMFDMWPEDYIFMRKLGAEDIVRRYRQFGPAWAIIGPKEPAFVQFVQEFCQWDPNAPEPAAAPDGVIDLEVTD